MRYLVLLHNISRGLVSNIDILICITPIWTYNSIYYFWVEQPCARQNIVLANIKIYTSTRDLNIFRSALVGTIEVTQIPQSASYSRFFYNTNFRHLLVHQSRRGSWSSPFDRLIYPNVPSIGYSIIPCLARYAGPFSPRSYEAHCQAYRFSMTKYDWSDEYKLSHSIYPANVRVGYACSYQLRGSRSLLNAKLRGEEGLLHILI